MRTIQKNRTAKFVQRITKLVSYTLQNGFSGETVPAENIARAMDFAVKCGAKFQIDDATNYGRVRLHSNHWYEFEAGPVQRPSRAKPKKVVLTPRAKSQEGVQA